MLFIESPANPRFRFWKKELLGGGRKEAGLALVCGRKVVDEFLKDFPGAVDSVLVKKGDDPPDLPKGFTGEVLILAGFLFTEMDLYGTHYPMLVVKVEEPPMLGDQKKAPKGALLALTFQDPGNLGAAVRTALGMGVTAALVMPGAASPFHSKAIRASSGAVFRLPLLRVAAESDLEGMTLLGLDSSGDDIRTFKFPADFVLMPGVEGPGLSEELRPEVLLSLPMAPILESYNATTAVAMAFYEWRRGRKD
jgi:tRNA G18 (ribose-2'-O)-methylase SpoU